MTFNDNNQEELDQLYQKNKISLDFLDRNVEKITSDFRETKSSDLSALKKRTIFKLDYLNKNIAYITAFVDGEGSFGCSINPRTDMKLGFQVIPEFNIVQSEVNVSILLAFFLYFGGVGYVKNNRSKSATDNSVRFTYCIRDLNHLKDICDFFNKHPLLHDEKVKELKLFEQIVSGMLKKEHLNIKGLYKISLLIRDLSKREMTAKLKERLAAIKKMYQDSLL